MTVAGPPTQTDTQQALYELPLPEVLALFIHTRTWEREHRAAELDFQALQLERQALLAGVEADKATSFVKALRDQATKLRRPEHLENERPKSVQEANYSASQRAFLQPYKYNRDGSLKVRPEDNE